MMTNDQDRVALIRQRLELVFAPLQLEIIDDSHQHAGHAGARYGGHFTLHIVSKSFTGKGMLERHRMVYKALENEMQSDIHALSIQAFSDEEV